MTPLLDVRDLGVSYGKLLAVRNLSLQMEASRTVTVIGPNGAGKSTLLKALMGRLPYSGVVTFNGEDLGRLDVEERVELGLVLVPETRDLFSEMSVLDNLVLGGFLHRRDAARRKSDLDGVFDLFPKLRERRAQIAGTLSGGERQMLALGRALMSRPKLLMLDEPSLGLAPLIVAEIFEIIDGLRRQGNSILLIEQNARAALKRADDGYVLETGEVAKQGRAHDLLHDETLAAAYLGGPQALQKEKS